MKRKNITSKIAAVLAGCFLMVGCSGNSNNNVNEPSVDPSEVGGDIVACTMETDAGYYMGEPIFPDGSTSFTYLDYATNQRVFLCSNPNCNHQNETCTSYVPENQWVSSACVIQDHLYVAQNETHNNTPPHIDVWDKDGSNRRQLVQFPESWQLVFDVEFGHVYTDEENMYFMVNVPAGNDYLTKTLVSVNIHTGDYKVLYEAEDYNPAVSVENAFGRKLLISIWDWGETDLDGISYRWYDVDTGKFEEFEYTAFDQVREILSGDIDGDIFYEDDESTKTLRYCDVKTQEWKEVSYAQVPMPTENVINTGVGYLMDDCFIFESNVQEGTEHHRIQYALDTRTGEFWPYDLHKEGYETEGVGVLAEHDGKLLVCYTYDEVSVPLPDGTTVPNWFPRYGWMTKEDYIHGNPVYEPIETDVYSFCR